MMLRAKLSQEPYIIHRLERLIKDITPLSLQLYCFKKSTLRYDFLCTNLRGFENEVSFKPSGLNDSKSMEDFGFWIGGGAGVSSISLSSYQGNLRINILANSEMIADPGAVCEYFVEELGQIVSAVEINNMAVSSNSRVKKD
jgi:hypothetical protein